MPRDERGRIYKGSTLYPNGRPKCPVAWCNNPQRKKGYCVRHYDHLRDYARILEHTKFDPRPSIVEGNIAKIPLGINSKDGYVIVDKKYAYLDRHKWILRKKDGYASTNIKSNGKSRAVLLHSLIRGVHKGLDVDHHDRNKLNNRLKNLRVVPRYINGHNKGPQSNNTSGYKGIYWANWVDMWRVRMQLKGKGIEGGYFKKIEDAVKRRKELESEHGL